jgi:hypothetical protein
MGFLGFGLKINKNNSDNDSIDKTVNLRDIYRIIDYKNGGELVLLARKAYLNNMKLIDEYIQKNIPPFLLNNGNGEWVKIEVFEFLCIKKAIFICNLRFPGRIWLLQKSNGTIRRGFS